MTLREAYQQARQHLEGTPFLTLHDRQRLKVLVQYIEVLEQEHVSMQRQTMPLLRSLSVLALREPSKSIAIPKAELEALPDTVNMKIEASEGGYTVRAEDAAPLPTM